MDRVDLADGFRAELARYLDLLDARFGGDVVSVVVFGSRARGAARAGSDLDLLVVARGLPVRRWARYEPFLSAARAVSDEFAGAQSVIALTPEEATTVRPYYLGMLSGHITLRDRDHFFESVLARLQGRLHELGARRYVDADGYEYWDLKPDWKPGDVVTL